MQRPFAIIAGGGPVGMVLALELGRRGIRCVLLNERPGPTDWPKANATSPRSMETLRRLGVARPALGAASVHQPAHRFFDEGMLRVRGDERLEDDAGGAGGAVGGR